VWSGLTMVCVIRGLAAALVNDKDSDCGGISNGTPSAWRPRFAGCERVRGLPESSRQNGEGYGNGDLVWRVEKERLCRCDTCRFRTQGYGMAVLRKDEGGFAIVFEYGVICCRIEKDTACNVATTHRLARKSNCAVPDPRRQSYRSRGLEIRHNFLPAR
jgi:hypothetical protein